jgi:DNA-binding NarL/FixJ family response regulator
LKIFEKEEGVPLKTLWKKLSIEESAQEDIDKFQVILAEASTDFFYTLGAQFPDLNEGDKRLAAMIGLGWSSSDIAKLENSSSSAIRTRKSRLKKKLQMDADTSLEDFISSLKREG